MFDRILMILEILLLIWIVVQGEFVRFYEREVWRMNADRFEERKQWREQKRQQLLKKETTQKTSESSASLESPSPTETNVADNKTISVKSAAVPLTPTVRPPSTTIISECKSSDTLIEFLWKLAAGMLRHLTSKVKSWELSGIK